MKTTISRRRAISNTRLHQVGRAKGNWWLRGTDGFVAIGSHRGDQPLSIEVDLEPGSYVLGCGLPNDYRETIVIEAAPVAEAAADCYLCS